MTILYKKNRNNLHRITLYSNGELGLGLSCLTPLSTLYSNGNHVGIPFTILYIYINRLFRTLRHRVLICHFDNFWWWITSNPKIYEHLILRMFSNLYAKIARLRSISLLKNWNFLSNWMRWKLKPNKSLFTVIFISH